ncbi:NAD(P)/FAD-dependent oxidoreductase [Rhodococcus sp. BP-349]|uniref:flavin-containing monooxygenase n=1 Tax=unclassified Rhodococcus (in: high G+C Gram-positive bacteria) TaxID=192944 RepID=UPI001C9B0182|nr:MULTISPECIES: NAD(P)/FAD-dependent oxidoreductase [unclassified Rhodococcus (in: high G+C Gram-positive bacteria)]MBY6537857.1 NAD(P)/FAD-dependent oxidoreductase [Rhodococcus sp. BP-363]MBY6542194.1 NAD(P)/FAD-dependent oxidoreductase [Rhodococcus sp. BP-369]MBY6561424.1 NAD(P)/FAD-dependent oxidoreductase [Rhodococcus sp. BP-370]MBY6575716.1 NAD(P)/FAD-dependent oxidoreductase [Rhodococcus sp. BP-364]MBY6585017.1 NAD(P)/FAD-dependent oxidoreductase [Rhodococcus sp. BP-358]
MTTTISPDVDVVVVGAGFAGLYALHKLRDTMTMTVRTFEAGSDVGGTWFWNRYPGARCDIESVHYSYSFDEDLQQEWQWSEKFAGQPEILRYLEHVADRFDLRKDITFGTRVIAVQWNDDDSMWEVTTDHGEVVRSRFFISGAGNLSVPKTPEFGGIENFRGEVLMTGNWPREGADLTGKRVAVIGAGASGIQVIPLIAQQASHLTVFQRTPNFATPLGNGPIDPDEVSRIKGAYSQVRDAARNHFLGVPFDQVQPSALAVDAEERRRTFDERWNAGGFRLFIDSYQDILFDKKANDTIADYIRNRIHERVTDPEVADMLAPTGYSYGTKRPPLETSYYETYNRDNVTLIDVKDTPVSAITPTGVQVGNDVHEADVIVLATGFDAMTGPLMAMDIQGRYGQRLADSWADGPRTYLGLMVHDFPNLFLITGPQSPSVLYNMPLAIEDHVDFATDAIGYLASQGLDVMEPRLHAQDQWVATTNEIAAQTLLPETNSWYMGANIPGKPRACMVYLAGAPTYRATCDDVVDRGYAGFALERANSRALTATS